MDHEDLLKFLEETHACQPSRDFTLKNKCNLHYFLDNCPDGEWFLWMLCRICLDENEIDSLYFESLKISSNYLEQNNHIDIQPHFEAIYKQIQEQDSSHLVRSNMILDKLILKSDIDEIEKIKYFNIFIDKRRDYSTETYLLRKIISNLAILIFHNIEDKKSAIKEIHEFLKNHNNF